MDPYTDNKTAGNMEYENIDVSAQRRRRSRFAKKRMMIIAVVSILLFAGIVGVVIYTQTRTAERTSPESGNPTQTLKPVATTDIAERTTDEQTTNPTSTLYTTEISTPRTTTPHLDSTTAKSRTPKTAVTTAATARSTTGTSSSHLIQPPATLEDLLDKLKNEAQSSNDTTQTAKQIIQHLSNLLKTPEDTRDMADDYNAEKKLYHSVALHYIAGKMKNTQGDSTAKFKHYRVQSIRNILWKATRQMRSTMEFVIPWMEDLLKELREVPSVSLSVKVEYEAWCIKDVALCYSYLDDNENYFLKNKEAIDLMKRDLGKSASNYRLLGICLNNAGAAKENVGDYAEALEYYKEAVQVHQSATDYSNEATRESDLSYPKRGIKNMKRRLGLPSI